MGPMDSPHAAAPRAGARVLALVIGVLFAGSALVHRAFAGGVDSDGDGLTDDFETYLATASSAARFQCDPSNPDSDGDGQPDGFEYCLSHGEDVVSPGEQHPVVPMVTLGSHQVGGKLVLSFYVVPADLQAIDTFHLIVAVPDASGMPVLADLTDVVATYGVESVSVASWGPYSMAVYRVLIPLGAIAPLESISFAVVGKVAGIPVGDDAAFTTYKGRAFRWYYTAAAGSGGQTVQGQARPQSTDVPPEAQAQEVCKTVDVTDPTETKGLVRRVTLSAGCTGGEWSCFAGICAVGGPLAQPKVVLDHLELLE